MLSGELRDVECGLDYARLYELGCFDREFVVYGVCYWQNGSTHYLVSENPEKIYKFVNASMLDECYCSDVLKRVVQHNVDSGTEDIVKKEIMLDMAKELHEQYGASYFEKMRSWIEKIPSDAAYGMLLQQQEDLQGCFDKTRIEMFEELCYQALVHKTLTRIKYDEFQRWIKHVYKQMEDDSIEKDKIKRDFSGFGYVEKDQIKYFFDANIVNVWEKKYERAKKGNLVTPILCHQYWFSTLSTLQKVRGDFKNLLAKYIDEDYIQCVKTANGL